MKKILILLLMISLHMNFAVYAHAQSAEKDVNVQISATKAVVNAGEQVVLTAESLKHGSKYTDSWSGAENNGTCLDPETGKYVSTAIFSMDKPGIYEITYDIAMYAGKSSNTFIGKGVYIVEVKGNAAIVGAEIGNIHIDKVLRPDGSLVGYSAMGNVYIVRSDNTRSLYSTIFFFFEPQETTKVIAVNIVEDGQVYKFYVPVAR